MRPARVRDEYVDRLRNTIEMTGVSLVAYCLTSSHVHLVASPDEPGRIATFMQRQQGEFARWYNRSHARSGAFWNERYHCTMIETGPYLWNCMRYVDLNMVRAGVVTHPLKWRWCGYDELVGQRKRYRVLDIPRVLELTECSDLAELAANYEAFVEEALAGERLAREARWTEAIAVGSERFVNDIAEQTRNRRRATLDLFQDADGTWAVREPECPYGVSTQAP